jgi:hypothetical protein
LNHDNSAQLPPVKVLFDLLDDLLIGCVSGPHPAAHRDAASSYGEGDDYLGQIRTFVLAVLAALAQTWPFLRISVFLSNLEVCSGGV